MDANSFYVSRAVTDLKLPPGTLVELGDGRRVAAVVLRVQDWVSLTGAWPTKRRVVVTGYLDGKLVEVPAEGASVVVEASQKDWKPGEEFLKALAGAKTLDVTGFTPPALDMAGKAST